MSITGQVPFGTGRNGLENEPHDYAYRGARTLEAELPYLCEGGCGRRLETDRWPLCAVCRGEKYYTRRTEGGRGPGKRR